jgi:hypothetical protein
LVISKENVSSSFWPKGQDISFLFFTHSAKSMTRSSSESELPTSSTNETFLFQVFLGSKALKSWSEILYTKWLKLSNSWEAYLSLICGNNP